MRSVMAAVPSSEVGGPENAPGRPPTPREAARRRHSGAVTGHPHAQESRAGGGTGRLADDFFLMAHEESTGKPRLAERIAGLGLAAALLGELALADRVELREGTVAVLDSSPREDALSCRVLEFLKQEQHPTRTWLAFFGRPLVALTGGIAMGVPVALLLRALHRSGSGRSASVR